MLVLSLRRHWYAEVAEGRKTVEYRALGRCRRSRLEKLGPGSGIVFRLGYCDRSSDLPATVEGIDVGPCPYKGWSGDVYRIRFRLQGTPAPSLRSPSQRPPNGR